MYLLERLKTAGQSKKLGVLALLVAVSATLIWVQLKGSSSGSIAGAGTNTHITRHPNTGVELQASLAQPMFVQGQDGTVYLDLGLVTPKTDFFKTGRRPSDMIVVLDRSGSMGEGNKWNYARQAVLSLLDRLKESDRIALVTFDSRARIDASLTDASGANIERLQRVVQSMGPGASTNLGEALLMAENLARNSRSAERRTRVIVLSDGHANQGIVDPSRLADITRRMSDGGSVVSTIGMGLGFNETVMAQLADQGMGSFNYLEHLESLGAILTQELEDSRSVYANASTIRLQLPSGVELIDAAGYPFDLDGRTAVIRTGQLFQDSTKRFMATLRVANDRPAEYPLGNIQLDYQVGGQNYEQKLESASLNIACVPPEKKSEAVASINKDLYREAWIRNNLGRVMKKVGDYVRDGRQEKAKELMESYSTSLDEAEEIAPGVREAAAPRLEELNAQLEDAFRGRDQGVKQNRAAKSLLGASQQLQRQTEKNR